MPHLDAVLPMPASGSTIDPLTALYGPALLQTHADAHGQTTPHGRTIDSAAIAPHTTMVGARRIGYGLHMKRWIYRHRAPLKHLLARIRNTLPAPLARRFMLVMETVAFTLTPAHQADTLPPVFHYWASRHVRPAFERLGATSPEDLYFREISLLAQARESIPLRVASLGAGACDLELRLARRLRDAGLDATLDCVDLNPRLMAAGETAARAQGLERHMRFIASDAVRFHDATRYDVLIVNQFFHHVDALEAFGKTLALLLVNDGLLLSSDVIGRNGHVLWPDVDTEVQALWRDLSEEQRRDRSDGKVKLRYESVDHAAYSNEGVRAQDVIASLLQHFDFEVFLSYGAVVIPFVERRFGFNFTTEGDDAALIDRIAQLDADRIVRGDYPASSMFAVLRHRGMGVRPIFDPVRPQRHVELTRQQLKRCDAIRA